jgi:hypothetical protein
MLFEQGESITYIQNCLGHSYPAVTLGVYTHFIKSDNQEAVCKLDSTIFEGTGHNMVTIDGGVKVANVYAINLLLSLARFEQMVITC